VAGQEGELRERLLRAAGQVLDAQGVEAVTVREVARRAGVSHGAPRRYFPTRALLLATLAQGGFAELGRGLDALDGTEPPARRLAQAGQVYLGLARSRPALFDLMTRHDLLEGSGVDLRSSSLAALGRWHDLVTAARPDATSQDSLLLFAAVHGVAALHSHRALDLLAQDPAALVDRLLDPPPASR
jgi:AcrR family transcriptional regulator